MTVRRASVVTALAILALAGLAGDRAGAVSRVRVQVLGARSLSAGAPLRLLATGLVSHARYHVVLRATASGAAPCAARVGRIAVADAAGRLRLVIAAPAGGWCSARSYAGRLLRAGAVRPVASFAFEVLSTPPGTLSGTVLVVSTCVGVPHSATACVPARPLAGAPLRVTDTAGRLVARATSDAGGQFGIHLGPGSYVLVAMPMGSLRAPAPQRLTVVAGRPLAGLTVRYALTGGSPNG